MLRVFQGRLPKRCLVFSVRSESRPPRDAARRDLNRHRSVWCSAFTPNELAVPNLLLLPVMMNKDNLWPFVVG